MAVEKERGCGFRKLGGLYVVSGKLAAPCGGLPIRLHVCEACGEGIKQSRSWTWIVPRRCSPCPRARLDIVRFVLSRTRRRAAKASYGSA